MHVLLVNHTGHVSGAEHSLLSLIAGLRSAGVRCTLACPPGALQTLASADRIDLHTIAAAEGSLRLHPTHTPRAVVEIGYAAVQVARLASRLKVDVIHANSIRASLVAGLAGQLCRRPCVAHLRDRLPSAVASKASLRLIGATCAHIVANSRYTLGALDEASVRGSHSVIHNPVDLELFQPASGTARVEARTQLGLDDEAFALGVVGQITPWKGQDTALRALAAIADRYPQLRLVIVGEAKFLSDTTRFDNGAYLESLQALARDDRLGGRVQFLGERDDVAAIIGALDTLLVPSHGEPFGRVVIEAMAVGTPVIASAGAGPAELIDDRSSGLLVDENDIDAWSQAIDRLVADESMRRRLAQGGRKRSADFSISAHAEQLRAVYREVLATRPGASSKRAD